MRRFAFTTNGASLKLFSFIVVTAIALSHLHARADTGRDSVPSQKGRPCCLVNAAPEQVAIFVKVDPPSGHESLRFIHFTLDTNIDLPEANLSILWDLPHGAWIYDPVVRLSRNGEKLDISDHLERDTVDPYLFNVALAGVVPGESISFSMGWQGAAFETYDASISLNRGIGRVSFFGGWRP